MDASLIRRSSEFAITPTELKPIRAPAMDGVRIVPVSGNSTPAATGIPTCVQMKRGRENKKKRKIE